MTEPRDARPADVGPGDVRRLLGGGWDCRFDDGPAAAGGRVRSAACRARRRDCGLVVHVDIDRGAFSILVGTGPDDMHPFEDLAVHLRWSDAERLRGLIDDDGGRAAEPLMPLPRALGLLAAHARDIADGFARRDDDLRNGLRQAADRFRDAWDDRAAGGAESPAEQRTRPSSSDTARNQS